jgi:hypothetical protein
MLGATRSASKSSGTPWPPSPTRSAPRFVQLIESGPAASPGRRRITHRRDDLRAGQPVHGSTVITEMDATTFIPPDFLAMVDASGNLHLGRRNTTGENP